MFDATRRRSIRAAEKPLRGLAQVISALSPRLGAWIRAIRRTHRTYRDRHGFFPSLMRPVRFTEKMQWRKLFDLNPVYNILCDKLAVREFVRERVGSELLVPLLWFGVDPDAIPFDTIEPPYIIKSTHGHGHAIIVEDRASLKQETVRETVRSWLGSCHGTALDEPGYVHVPPRLIVERLLLRQDGSPPREYKIFLFDGTARVVQSVTVSATDRARFVSHHTLDWIELPWTVTHPRPSHPVDPPRHLDEILAVAKCLGAGFAHIRVDLYDCDDRIYVGEMTPYSYSGLHPIQPDSADFTLGTYWNLRSGKLRALWTILARRHEIRRLNG